MPDLSCNLISNFKPSGWCKKFSNSLTSPSVFAKKGDVERRYGAKMVTEYLSFDALISYRGVVGGQT